MDMVNVKMVPVSSSNLKAIGWIEKNPKVDGSIDMIAVEFHRGAVYHYFPVTRKQYEEGIKAVKASEWFNSFKVGKGFKKV
jgi:hypothetical protein